MKRWQLAVIWLAMGAIAWLAVGPLLSQAPRGTLIAAVVIWVSAAGVTIWKNDA